jgi:hypothetical protein
MGIPGVSNLLAAGETPREIAAKLSHESGLPKRAVYNRALELRPGSR